MNYKYACIDESGDTGYTKKSSRYFIVTSVLTDDILKLRRIVKDVHKYKIGKKKASALHAYKETKIVKNKFVKKLENNEIFCVVSMLDKHKLQVKDSYKYALDKLARYFEKLKVEYIFIARMDTRKNYNREIVGIFRKYGLNITFATPTTERSLQIADFYSWSIFSHLEYKRPEYFLFLADNTTFI